MEPENTGRLEEEHHLNQSIILTFFFWKTNTSLLDHADFRFIFSLGRFTEMPAAGVEIWWWLRQHEKHALWSHESDKEAALVLCPSFVPDSWDSHAGGLHSHHTLAARQRLPQWKMH